MLHQITAARKANTSLYEAQSKDRQTESKRVSVSIPSSIVRAYLQKPVGESDI